jgi:hypothetical protein
VGAGLNARGRPTTALYGWYQIELGGLCPGTRLTAPKVGAVRSTDSGAAWNGFGIVLEARPNTLCYDTTNFHQENSQRRRCLGKYRAYGCALNCALKLVTAYVLVVDAF